MTPAQLAERTLEDVCRVTGLPPRAVARYGQGRTAYARHAWLWLVWEMLGCPPRRVVAEACGVRVWVVKAARDSRWSPAWKIVKAVLRCG